MESSLQSGSSIAHYRVLSSIGAGGMGQVFKVQDLTLDRTVALKVLPPEVVRNEERVRRFVQEAKSASSLNHPNIVTIYEIGEASPSSPNGAGESGLPPIHYIAMELIDGATLKRRIHDGATDLRTLIGYLAQAAEGLAKAHAAGIVHRDLKPENIMVTRDGFAKVLDFGLAKLNVSKSTPEGNTATDLRDGTREGAVLGTVGYMSPEQVRGQLVDHRSDIFSFGCILYEASTRQRAFQADSDVDVMHKIMHDKPAPIDEIAPLVPAELRRMIRRCLAKDPERRYQSMKDLAIELTDVVDEFEELSASTASRTSGSISQPLPSPAAHRRRIAVAITALVVTTAVAVWALTRWRTAVTAPGKPSAAYATMKMEQVTTSNRVVQQAVSPDGKYVALVNTDSQGRFNLSVMQLATSATIQIVPPTLTPFSGIAFSPDSNYLLYSNQELASGRGYASLYQVPSLGGTPSRILFDIDTAVAFSPDGKRIAFERGHPDTGENWIMIANADGSGERKLFAFKRLIGPVSPAWTPDGQSVLTPILRFTKGFRHELTEINVTSGATQLIGKPWVRFDSLALAPSGKVVVVSGAAQTSEGSQIWLQPYPAGEAIRITNDLNQYLQVSTTADGSKITAIRQEQDSDLLSVKPGQPASPALLLQHSSNQVKSVSLSRGGRMAVTVDRGDGVDVAIVEPGSDKPRLITHDGTSEGADLSSDGKVVVFHSSRQGGIAHLYVADTDGGSVRQLTSGGGEVGPTLSPDGTTVTFNSLDGTIWRVGTGGGVPVRIGASPAAVEFVAGPISPDGKRFTYQIWRKSGLRSDRHLLVADLQDGKILSEIPWPAGQAIWGPDGRSLICQQRSGGVDNIYRTNLDGSGLSPMTTFNDGIIVAFDIAADGSLVVSRAHVRSDVVLVKDTR